MSEEGTLESASEETTDDEIISDEETGTIEDDPQQQEIENLQKQLLDTKRAYTEGQMALAELTGRLDERGPAEPQEDWLSKYDEDEVAQNPMLAIEAIQRLRQEIVDVVRAGNTNIESRFRALDPERVAFREEIEALRQDPDLAELDEDVLVMLAKRDKRQSKVTPKPTGAPGGGQRRSAAATGKDVKESSLYKAMYPEEAA